MKWKKIKLASSFQTFFIKLLSFIYEAAIFFKFCYPCFWCTFMVLLLHFWTVIYRGICLSLCHRSSRQNLFEAFYEFHDEELFSTFAIDISIQACFYQLKMSPKLQEPVEILQSRQLSLKACQLKSSWDSVSFISSAMHIPSTSSCLSKCSFLGVIIILLPEPNQFLFLANSLVDPADLHHQLQAELFYCKAFLLSLYFLLQHCLC